MGKGNSWERRTVWERNSYCTLNSQTVYQGYYRTRNAILTLLQNRILFGVSITLMGINY